MMKKILGLAAVSIMFVMATGCNMSPSTDSSVKQIPVIWTSAPSLVSKTSVSKIARSITLQTGDLSKAEFDCCFGPAVTGFQSNSLGVGVGGSFTSSAFRSTVTTTISAYGTDTIFSGLFSDGISNYTLTLHKDNTFDFVQTLTCNASDNSIYITAFVKISGGTLYADGSFSGSETGYCYYYTPGTTPTAAYMFSTGLLFGNSAFYGVRAQQSSAPSGVFPSYPGTETVAPDSTAHLAQVLNYMQTTLYPSTPLQPWDWLSFHDSANGWARVGGTDNTPATYLDPLSDSSNRNIQDLTAAVAYESTLPGNGGLTTTTITGEQYINYVWTQIAGQ
jgi:hypothetical protein